ncbi:MAG TPA: hypothetical protein VGO61_00610 [Steroidobacteraceae bacterium]|jgi:uncharacterized protein|nr:hypothetical protein [Steroidobacteraceae bacterium]
MRLFPVFALCCLGGIAQAASFDCSKAATATEKAICANPHVSDLDEYLGRYYQAGRATMGRDAAACLGSNQRDWLRSVRNLCKNAACLERVYLSRLAELDPLQAGAAAVKNLELPFVKSMVWIIGPAADTVAAPRNVRREPLVVTGKLVDDVATGDGFVIQDKAGVKHVLLLLMFIDKADGVMLEAIARDTPATFEAHGEREIAGGEANFAPSACTFLYRLPK